MNKNTTTQTNPIGSTKNTPADFSWAVSDVAFVGEGDARQAFATAATKQSIRESWTNSPPVAARTAAGEFKVAFDAVFNLPQHELFRDKTGELVKNVAKADAGGTRRAEEIMGILHNSGLVKALVAHDKGSKHPGLKELAESHEKLMESFEPLKTHIEKLRQNPDGGISLLKGLGPDTAEQQLHKKAKAGIRLSTAGF